MAEPARDDVQLPRPALEVLIRSAIHDRAGTGLALREAGRAAGADIAGRIAALAPTSGVGAATFWAAANAETVARGLGSLRWVARGDAAAEVIANDALDAIPAGSQIGRTRPPRPDAPFSEGLVEGLLSRIVGEQIGSLAVEVRRSGESPALHLLVGSPAFLRVVRRRLDAGEALEAALEES